MLRRLQTVSRPIQPLFLQFRRRVDESWEGTHDIARGVDEVGEDIRALPICVIGMAGRNELRRWPMRDVDGKSVSAAAGTCRKGVIGGVVERKR
jgi:hypothetical protein